MTLWIDREMKFQDDVVVLEMQEYKGVVVVSCTSVSDQ
ncbi:hypothetical protein Dpep_1607 [Dethiosulfovibrio peptidovorans DSM 11002]|uniref:Uncharacterized protein n=1 Tax=Dethiosulfovibrio peptidovorans DSM 11002 TaxID=469381 RepID=D2Z836_9BACT|nr:hypothetical protein Dpep_1607 [Dethiosulfovibrio peptidovorans DSM 11002]